MELKQDKRRPLEHRIDLHLHGDGDTAAILRQILHIVTVLQQQGKVLMATTAQLQEKVDAINAAVDGIAADIAALKAQVQDGANTDAILASLDALASRVTALDAENPPPAPA